MQRDGPARRSYNYNSALYGQYKMRIQISSITSDNTNIFHKYGGKKPIYSGSISASMYSPVTLNIGPDDYLQFESYDGTRYTFICDRLITNKINKIKIINLNNSISQQCYLAPGELGMQMYPFMLIDHRHGYVPADKYVIQELPSVSFMGSADDMNTNTLWILLLVFVVLFVVCVFGILQYSTRIGGLTTTI